MKLTQREKELIFQRRRFIKTKNTSKTILKFRKASKPSMGEAKIAKFFDDQNIQYKREWFFRDLYNKATGHLLYFDFFLPGFHICIEYDGPQHYDSNKTENQKINDFLKNAYCKKNNIHFFRIKYTDIDNCEKLICEFFDKVDPIIMT
ncbi:MAG: hypothetical protein H0X41_03165 [Chitinophagaceae bacterium]|nr:hypothetical protein [Chitinophagaceae bacterium]